MKDFTTMEKLQMKVSATYGSVLKFWGLCPGYGRLLQGQVYSRHLRVCGNAGRDGLGDIECRLNHIGSAEQTFPDNGHAIKWCMEQAQNKNIQGG